MPNKIFLGPTTPEAFDAITFQALARQGVICSEELAATIRHLCFAHGASELRGCYPGDLCSILTSIAAYERKPSSVSPEKLEEAARIYFTHHEL